LFDAHLLYFFQILPGVSRNEPGQRLAPVPRLTDDRRCNGLGLAQVGELDLAAVERKLVL
jgi:hypothetical protein